MKRQEWEESCGERITKPDRTHSR